ncbi:hypothetical protein ABIC88_003277 [Pseudomonas kilonensis]
MRAASFQMGMPIFIGFLSELAYKARVPMTLCQRQARVNAGCKQSAKNF